MKNILKSLFSGLALVALVGCEAEYQPDYARIYIGQSVESPTKRIMFNDTSDIETTLSVKLVSTQNADVKFNLAIDSVLLNAYNEANGASYAVLPDEFFAMEHEFSIPKGKTSIEIPLTLKFFEDDAQYALPLMINNVEGPVQAAASSSKLVVLLDKPLIQDVPEWDRRSVPQSMSEWGITTKDWSIETWVWMSGFQINNQAIINMSASTEIYIRFGDTSIDFNTLQVKCGGSQVNNPTHFDPCKWYHLAFVYSQSLGKLQLYVNGEPTGQLVVDIPETTINGMQLASSGDYFLDKCRMAQFRVWKRALTQTEINTNKLVTVNPAADGLIGYWKFNEGEDYASKHPEANWDGRTFYDCTANHFDLHLAQYGNVWWIKDGFKAGK